MHFYISLQARLFKGFTSVFGRGVAIFDKSRLRFINHVFATKSANGTRICASVQVVGSQARFGQAARIAVRAGFRCEAAV